jgi:Protein of unknown function (DUF3808)
MQRIGSWLQGSSKSGGNVPDQAFDSSAESKDLEDAMMAATLIMNDDIEGAEKGLKERKSSFHQLGRGVTIFMRSLLGFEQDIMKEASERLAMAENAAWTDMKRIQKENGGFHSNIYPPGTEFALCYAEAQLMSAVIGVLNESLTESIKGFYKLRKAYITLDGIMEIERKYMRQKEGLNNSSKTSLSSHTEEKHMPGGFDENEFIDDVSAPVTRNTSSTKLVDEIANKKVPVKGRSNSSEDDGDLEWKDCDENHSEAQAPANYISGIQENGTMQKIFDELTISTDDTVQALEPDTAAVIPEQRRGLDQGPDSDIFKNPIDIFIHSGGNLCYGLLLLIISMVPPAFSRLLYIIGFKGDRGRGIQMLWQSTKFPNINGAVAGLVLLGYYNGLVGFSDIILTDDDNTSDNITGFPKARCRALLEDMRSRYPQSRLWRLEEARMHSANRNLESSIDILSRNEDSPMKQISALNMFEKSLNSMFFHDYNLCTQSFLKCVKLNNWSHALYHFIAGCAQVELYRRLKKSDPKAAVAYKDKATELIRKAPTFAGKKRLMAKQMPFDVYVVRKVQKWEERAKEWGVDLIDTIGVSPVEEMIYLWNGSKKMPIVELESSLTKLDWNQMSQPEKHMSNLDEVALQALAKAGILRNLGRLEEARTILKEKVLRHDKYDIPLVFSFCRSFLLLPLFDTTRSAHFRS